MAAVATMSAQHAPVTTRKSKADRYSVDAGLLAARLANLQMEETDIVPVQPGSKRDPSKHASYVPQNAAKVFAATTSTMPDEPKAMNVKRAKTVAHREKPVFSADGRPCVNPKQLHAALAMGMSEGEAATNVAAIPERRSSSHDEQQRGHTHGDRKRRESEPTEKPQRTASTRAYRPGDAAKRNAAYKRQSLQPPPREEVQPGAKLLPVKQGIFRTKLERESEPGSGVPASHAQIEAEKHCAIDESEHAPHRPHLQPHDRHNWAQESQCGEEMHHFFRHRNSNKPSAEHHENDGPYAADGWKPSRPHAPRQKSSDSIPDNLVSDAVSKIKKEEKVKRRRSLAGLFRRGS